jgi:hypothetical protein
VVPSFMMSTAETVFHDVYCGNQLPRAHDLVANFRFRLTEHQGGAESKPEQQRRGVFHSIFSGIEFSDAGQKAITVSANGG